MTATAVDERAEWLAWRRHGIGASDVAGILGISPWSSPWSVWADKVGLTGDQDETEIMEAGRWLELAVAPWFAHRTGLHVVGEQTPCVHPDLTIARCTVDGFVVEGPTDEVPLGPLQIKTAWPGKRYDELPAHHQAQGQWEMFVTGHDVEWWAILMGRRLDVHQLERNDDDIAFMVERVDRFWTDHVVTGVPPATDGHEATLSALAEVYPTSTPGVSVEVDQLADTLAVWGAAKAARKAAEAAEKAAAAEIQAALGDSEEGTIDGQRAVTWRSQERRSLDLDSLRRAEPEIAKAYERTTSFRVLRPAGGGGRAA